MKCYYPQRCRLKLRHADRTGGLEFEDMTRWVPRVSTQPQKAGTTMGTNADQAKGRIKQAVGDLTDDRDLKREGKADERAGKAKQAVGDLKDKADDLIDRTRAKLDRD